MPARGFGGFWREKKYKKAMSEAKISTDGDEITGHGGCRGKKKRSRGMVKKDPRDKLIYSIC